MLTSALNHETMQVSIFLLQIVVQSLIIVRSQQIVVRSLFTDQMAEWYRASAYGSADLRFDSESGQTSDCKVGIHSFPA